MIEIDPETGKVVPYDSYDASLGTGECWPSEPDKPDDDMWALLAFTFGCTAMMLFGLVELIRA